MNDPFAGLLAAAREGDPNAFQEMFDRIYAQLVPSARRMLSPSLRRRMGASDLVQQSAFRAWQSLDGFQGETEEEFRSWIHQILISQLKMAARHHLATARRSLRNEQHLDQSQQPPSHRSEARESESWSGTRTTIEEITRLASGILTTEELTLFAWRNEQHWPFSKIASHLGLTEGATRAKYQRIIQKIRKQMPTTLLNESS